MIVVLFTPVNSHLKHSQIARAAFDFRATTQSVSLGHRIYNQTRVNPFDDSHTCKPHSSRLWDNVIRGHTCIHVNPQNFPSYHFRARDKRSVEPYALDVRRTWEHELIIYSYFHRAAHTPFTTPLRSWAHPHHRHITRWWYGSVGCISMYQIADAHERNGRDVDINAAY